MSCGSLGKLLNLFGRLRKLKDLVSWFPYELSIGFNISLKYWIFLDQHLFIYLFINHLQSQDLLKTGKHFCQFHLTGKWNSSYLILLCIFILYFSFKESLQTCKKNKTRKQMLFNLELYQPAEKSNPTVRLSESILLTFQS